MDANPVPKLTTEERRAALDKALAARRRRGELKQLIRDGEISFFDLFDMDEDCVRRAKTVDMLKAIPVIGDVKAEFIMNEAGISMNRRIGGVGIHQREKLEQIIKDNGWD